MIPSALAYLAACAGIYRLARQWLQPPAAALALAFFAANPNLLYLQTTAMTEPLFLCEMIWTVGLAGRMARKPWRPNPNRAARLLWCIAAVLVAAVFTRYDGWMMALLAWVGMGLVLAAPRRTALAHLLAGERTGGRRAVSVVRLQRNGLRRLA